MRCSATTATRGALRSSSAALAAAIVLAGCHGDDAAEPAPVAVARVVDGDTIVLANGDVVRLVQIDAPEIGDGECYAAESAAFLEAIVGHARVRLEFDPAIRSADEDKVDRHGRLLRYVHVGKLNVNLELVRRGHAAPWFFAGVRGRYADRLLAAAREARARRLGLWDVCPRAKLDPEQPLETN